MHQSQRHLVNWWLPYRNKKYLQLEEIVKKTFGSQVPARCDDICVFWLGGHGSETANELCKAFMDALLALLVPFCGTKAPMHLPVPKSDDYFGYRSYRTESFDETSNILKLLDVLMLANESEAAEKLLTNRLDETAKRETFLEKLVSKQTKEVFQKCEPLLQLVAKHVADLQQRIARGPPPFSWRMPHARYPTRPNFVDFLHSDQVETQIHGFNNIKHARNFPGHGGQIQHHHE